jgi:transposase
MITPGADLKVYVATRPVDFRKGHDGLAALVQQMFGLDPSSGAAFVFRAKRADRVKILVWDRTGMVLVHKRLESSILQAAGGGSLQDEQGASPIPRTRL